jgi:hypothetical protein
MAMASSRSIGTIVLADCNRPAVAGNDAAALGRKGAREQPARDGPNRGGGAASSSTP